MSLDMYYIFKTIGFPQRKDKLKMTNTAIKERKVKSELWLGPDFKASVVLFMLKYLV